MVLSKPFIVYKKKGIFSKVGTWRCPFYIDKLAPFLSV